MVIIKYQWCIVRAKNFKNNVYFAQKTSNFRLALIPFFDCAKRQHRMK